MFNIIVPAKSCCSGFNGWTREWERCNVLRFKMFFKVTCWIKRAQRNRKRKLNVRNKWIVALLLYLNSLLQRFYVLNDLGICYTCGLRTSKFVQPYQPTDALDTKYRYTNNTQYSVHYDPRIFICITCVFNNGVIFLNDHFQPCPRKCTLCKLCSSENRTSSERLAEIVFRLHFSALQ